MKLETTHIPIDTGADKYKCRICKTGFYARVKTDDLIYQHGQSSETKLRGEKGEMQEKSKIAA